MDEKRPICLHFHIFKNAGTTIEWILKKNFSKYAISVDNNNPEGRLYYENILEIMREKPKTKSISSHQFRFPLKDNDMFEFISIIFLRQPIDRAISIYHFQRKRTDANRPGIVKAKELDLNNYIKWNLDTKNHMAMKNFQVLYLSDKPLRSIVDENDYKIAQQRMKDAKIIGLVDRFDESLVVAEERLRLYFPDIDMSYIKQNVSIDRGGSLEEKFETGKRMVEKDIMNRLKEKNELDLKLYSKVNEELDMRIKDIENFGEKIIEFQKRCKAKK